MTHLDEIPMTSAPPAQAVPSAVVARIRAIRPSRRTVLRGLVIGAAAAALVPLDWYLSRREAAAQDDEDEDEDDDRSEHLTCTPSSYDEESNNWPDDGAALCYGGWRRGSYPCSGGFHREGEYESQGDYYESTRLTTSCDGKNAWRWRGYRCSDAVTEVYYDDGDSYRGLTIAACELPDTEGEPAAALVGTGSSPS
ncbi:hypothetical protein ACQPZA_09520 [Pseudonocardia xinjiangensis]|uniref:MORN repeat protein n=1 Tax=Pseudonocardia xinjiangensis TaxID=75289 RepID=A0ABX1RGJ7_9PSEU|nr:hypothetical protein [Pseudonocardia xinjiangensis]NMH79515.1 hypothetical protein [Pseudonocardia xinjiangensis]